MGLISTWRGHPIMEERGSYHRAPMTGNWGYSHLFLKPNSRSRVVVITCLTPWIINRITDTYIYPYIYVIYKYIISRNIDLKPCPSHSRNTELGQTHTTAHQQRVYQRWPAKATNPGFWTTFSWSELTPRLRRLLQVTRMVQSLTLVENAKKVGDLLGKVYVWWHRESTWVWVWLFKGYLQFMGSPRLKSPRIDAILEYVFSVTLEISLQLFSACCSFSILLCFFLKVVHSLGFQATQVPRGGSSNPNHVFWLCPRVFSSNHL